MRTSRTSLQNRYGTRIEWLNRKSAEMIEQAVMFAPAILIDLIGKRGGSETAKRDFVQIKTIADELLTKKRITTKLYKQIVETTADYAEDVVNKDVKVADKKGELADMLARVGYVEPLQRIINRHVALERAEAKAELAKAEAEVTKAEAKGEVKGEVKFGIKLGFTTEQIAKTTGLSITEIDKIIKEIENAD
jgi:hypothetical protein